MKQTRLYFIGMPGSGKSTEGKRLANFLGWNFVDLDLYIEELAGTSIENIFAEHGELYFREIEKKALHNTFSFLHTIVACGGGVVAFDDNMQQINNHGASIYLNASNHFLLSRIKASKRPRPLFLGLSDEKILQKITELKTKREPYFQLAHATFEVPQTGVKALINKACSQFNLQAL